MTLGLSQLGLLLFVSALVAILTRRFHMPYTVGVVLAAAVTAGGMHYALDWDWGSACDRFWRIDRRHRSRVCHRHI
jgi:hypothetical protein